MPLPTGDPGDIEISFGDIIGNRGQAESNVEIKAESEFFALGASVGDVDGNGTPNLTADRDALDAAPYSISEFYGAQYPNVYFDNPIAKVSTTSVMGNGFVDGETARIYFDVNLDQVGTTDYTAGLKYASNNNVVVEDDGGSADPLRDLSVADNTHYADMTIPNIGGANDLYYPFVTTGTYSNAVGANINHYDQLAGGSTNLTTDGSTGYTSATVSTADGSVTAVVVGGSVSTGTQTSITLGSITSITAGDGGTMAGTYGSGESSNNATITNTPGVIRFAVQHNGGPTTARNNTSSTQDFTVSYVLAIDGVASSDHTVNSGTAFTITAISEGLTSTTTMRMGYSTSNSNTSYDGSADKSISTSQFVRSTQTNAFTVNLTSGTSLATYYPKAHYTSGTATTTAGSAIYIAPAYSYSTTGNQTINVNATQAMAVSSVVGNNSSVAITSTPSSQTGTNSATFTPSTNNGVYTINYAGTANYSQTSNTTDTLTVRPIVALARSTATVYGLGSYATDKTPTGVSTTNVTITTSVTGTASTYNWTLPSGTTVSGGGSGDPTAVMNFSGASGTKTFSATVTGRAVGASDTTSTSDSIDVAYVAYTQQNITSVTPTSGDYRRGATTINVAWTSINVALVDIHLVADGSGTSTTLQVNANDSMDSANTSEAQSYSAAIVDVGMSNVGTYHVRVQDDSDSVPSTTAVSTISVLDTAPTTPGAFQDSAGGHNGSLAMDWAASSYAYHYQVYKSSGDSDGSYSQLGGNQAGVSKTISELSGTATYGPFYYKIRALNFAQGGTSTEYSSYNTARRFIIYPTLDANNNIPQPSTSTIYSTSYNSTTTETSMLVTSDSDNVTGYSWAFGFTSGASASSTSAQNPTITAGAGVGTITTALTVSGNESQTYVHSTDNITVNYYPKIVSDTHTGGTIIVNSTDVIVSAIGWQGFAEGTGLQLSIRNGSGGIVGSNTNVNYANTEGGAQTFVSKTGLSINLGDSSSAGTMKVRISKQSDTSFYYESDVIVVDYTSVGIYGIGAGYSTPEHALVAKLAGWSSANKQLAPGTSWGNGVTLYDDNDGNVYNGGNYYHGYKPGGTTNYHTINPYGVIGNIYAGDDTVPPRDPSGASTSAAQTSISISSFSVSNYVFNTSGTTTATFSSWATTKTVTVTWNDNSALEQGYSIYQNNSSGTLKGTASANAETVAISGITAGITFAVYARRDISEETSVLSLNASTTAYSHSNDGTLYLHATNNSGGATTNLDSITSGTTFTWDKDDLAVGTYTFRVRYGSYTGTTIATDSSVTVSAATSWSSVSAGDVGDTKGAFDTNGRFSITVTDGVGDTTLSMPVAAVSSEQLGVISSLSSGVSAPANAAAITTSGALGGWSGGGGYEVTHTHSGLHTTTYYFWFGFTPNHGSDGVIETLTITWSNNGITRDQDVVLRQVASGGGKGGE